MVTVGPSFRDRLLYICPVVVAAVLGGAWIAVNAGGGRGQVHTVWQVLVLTENSAALLLRRRKPVGSLAGVLLAYGLFQLYAITLLPVLVENAAIRFDLGDRDVDDRRSCLFV